MGITGLLPFLEKSSRWTNIKEFAGGSVAIDSYCWLHKGIFSCAEKISIGEPTDAYVIYCMKFIDMLLKHNIKPILVFDGRHLPAKAATESKRRENREKKRRKAAELIRSGQSAEGRNLLRQSIDVTHEIALELIKTCQSFNIDCIVAPYEADAQLAYLNISGIADIVITEDSDLTLFGCKRVFFKMDMNGNGLLVEQDKLHLAMDMKSTDFNMDQFLYMCILSGCDYLPSLRGIGLSKAKKFITMNSNCDIHRALTNLGTCLNMRSLTVSQEYRDDFVKAFITFKHQLVFCPLQRRQVRLNPPTADVTPDQLRYAGEEIDDCDKALQLAYGNCDPFTFQQLHDFDPDQKKNLNKRNKRNPKMPNIVTKHTSIWSSDYKLKQNVLNVSIEKTINYEHQLCTKKSGTSEKAITMQQSSLKKTNSSKKQKLPDVNSSNYQELNEKNILEAYKSEEVQSEEKIEKNANRMHFEEEDLHSSDVNEQTSPVLIRKANPFAKEILANKVSPSLLFKRKSRIRSGHLQHRETIIDRSIVTESKFFASTNEHKNSENNVINNDNDMNSAFSEPQIYHPAKRMKIEDVNNITNDVNHLTDISNPNDAHSMDIDQLDQNMSISEDQDMSINEEQNISISKKQNIIPESIIEETITTQHIHCLDQINESRNLFISKDELGFTNSNVNGTMENYNCKMQRSYSPSSESEYSVSQNSIEDNTSSLFKFAYIKSSTSKGIQSTKTTETRLSSSKMETKNKSASKRGHRNKQLPPEHGQKNLLSMFGFDKKVNLRH
ncbi:hypothetical protein KPH14_005809 [Odynerus spinipes]|uniref:Exonuclease 1 n=1 Tax=Odynerus spinipes TaxID=1348599 RepID=A0AAD9RB40_9HYME|nr:hypothetical protein KPH14_005809 [Odynerus spinipes]